MAPVHAHAQFTRASTAADGTQANGTSTPGAFTPDGRYVAFSSEATNLVPGDTNGSIDVFVKDLQTGAIARVSVASDGTERQGDSGVRGIDISQDGNVIAFSSRAALAANDTNDCLETPDRGVGPSCEDIYVHDRTTGETVRASVTGAGAQASGPSYDAVLSSSGQFVAFVSEANDLVGGDTNFVSDIFLRDRVAATTTRVSVSSTGVEGNRASFRVAISGDGQSVAFVSFATTLASGDSSACGSKAYLHVRGTGATTIVPGPCLADETGGAIYIAMSGDGRFIAAHYSYILIVNRFPVPQHEIAIYDRLTSTTVVPSVRATGPVAISDDARHVMANSALIDRVTMRSSFPPQLRAIGDLSPDGTKVLFSSTGQLVPEDTSAQADVYVWDRDGDNDTLLDDWETLFGLDPANAADAALDADGDGLTTLQEFNTNGHPTGSIRRYFAEGAQNGFFNTYISLANPGAAPAAVMVRKQYEDGQELVWVQSVAAGRHAAVPTDQSITGSYSTVIESNVPVLSNRRMVWGSTLSDGAHGETSIAAPAETWYLAEGATHGGFDLFYLLQNPTDTAAQVTVDYLRPSPSPVITKTYTVAPRSRHTIWVDDEGPDLAEADISATITATQPIIVERSMYFSRPGQSFIAGHNGAGQTAPATRWFLAEGATGSFFDLYVLIANPGDTTANLSVTYLLADGEPIVRPYTVGPRSRLTISVEGEDARLASTAVSTIVESTNGQPIIVERSMWWPGPDWYEASLAAGATTTGTRWGFADGVVSQFSETYALVANTSAQDGAATVRLLMDDGPVVERVVALPAQRRTNIRFAELFPEALGHAFGVVVDTNGGVEIVVEQANYFSSEQVIWGGGYAALATKLQ